MRSVHMKIGIIDFRRLRAVEMTLQKRSPSIKNAHFWTFQTASEGNPFFLEESVRTLVETQVLVGERGGYRLAQALPSIQVPATVQAVLAARIDRLPPEAKN